MTTTCNGWRNAATWTVNLWFGDSWTEQAEEGRDMRPAALRDDVEAYVDDALGGDGGFIWDMLDLNAVDWQELADHHTTIVEG